ncbi:MAG: WecB/TagA/CpsF family glycosyltransferase [Candidatus Kerfeldbacteria bacterium]|nr:WecB/TagA/CpsF family glycosyltransferase [Candidatus Kerfeldbacteria bacterium]
MDTRPTILNVPFDAVTLPQALAQAEQALISGRFCHVVTPGPEFVMLARRHQPFAAVLRRSALSLPDGMGVILAARVLGLPALHRVAGTDFMQTLLVRAAEAGWRVYFFGCLRPGAIEHAAHQAVRAYPGLRLVGAESGWRGRWRLPDRVVTWRIRRAQPDLLFVGLGAPEQELWIDRHRSQLGRVAVAVGVGGAFDYLAGVVRRAPKPLRVLGFEWLWRLLRQPQRWQRIITAVVRFPVAVLQERWRHA